MTDERGLLGVIGLCRGAGRAVIGTPMVCEALRGGAREAIVIEASDTSENTHKRITDKCAYYKVRHVRIESDSLTLGAAVGKSAVAAVMINDAGFCRAVEKKLAESGKTTS
jgi:ribosomal protein L7Ae-like RNA K-turn-binding protein